MKKIFFCTTIILLLIIIVLNLLDVITNKYIIASMYIMLAFLIGWIHCTSSKKNKSKIFRICAGVFGIMLLTLIFIKSGTWERWSIVVMGIVMLLFACVSKRLSRSGPKDETFN